MLIENYFGEILKIVLVYIFTNSLKVIKDVSLYSVCQNSLPFSVLDTLKNGKEL